MNLDILSELTTVALDRQPWLRPLEARIQEARKQAPWHLWLDKYSLVWARRCDAAEEHWSTAAKEARVRGDRDRAKELKRKADDIPSGKTAALLVSVALARSSQLLDEDCRRKKRWLDRIEIQAGKDRFRRVTLVNESRLLLHLGRASVLENVGLYCDRSTGLLVIPGTAVKGVLSTWACWAANEALLYAENPHLDKTRRELARRILGDNSGQKGEARSGEVIFSGGFPTSPPVLGLDIVNPHHDAEGRTKERLTPNAFLAVEPGTLWQFCSLVHAGALEPNRVLDQTEAWLREALTQVGLGAKTASGYGRFREPSKDDLAAQAREAERVKAAEMIAAEEAKRAAEKAKMQAAAQLAMSSDYPNEATYKNSVLRLADNPGQWSTLQREIEKLRKLENATWLARFKRDTSERAYKKLREQPWYPK